MCFIIEARKMIYRATRTLISSWKIFAGGQLTMAELA